MPNYQTLLAFDYGTKRIGVAVGQTITRTANPLKTIINNQQKFQLIQRLINEWAPQALLVGLPLTQDDKSQPITIKARSFSESLKTHYQLPVLEIDETLTTKAARHEIFEQGGYQALQKTDIDSIAACFILENWFKVNR